MIIECNIKTIPFDCFQILEHYHYKIYTYSEMKRKNPELYQMCIAYSEDAFRMGSKSLIAYNDTKPLTRVRFSLMHELGHHILKHRNDTPTQEREANYFASNLLAPRLIMYYARLKKIREITDIFALSSAASHYAAQDFSRWCQEVCEDGMHDYDQALYKQFYHPKYDGLVYSFQNCEYCGRILYNSRTPYCENGCRVVDDKIDSHMPDISCTFTHSPTCSLTEDDRTALTRLENHWLYNF